VDTRLFEKCCYEAEPTGCGPVRLLRSADLPAEVVATIKTPRMTDSSAKTDRLNCRQLAEYATKGLLTFVAVTTQQREDNRLYHRADDRNAPMDNNLVEHQLRPLVIARKISFGS
jgi:hypothetical protein